MCVAGGVSVKFDIDKSNGGIEWWRKYIDIRKTTVTCCDNPVLRSVLDDSLLGSVVVGIEVDLPSIHARCSFKIRGRKRQEERTWLTAGLIRAVFITFWSCSTLKLDTPMLLNSQSI